MATFFQAETPANLEKLPQTNKEYAVKHIFNTRNHARFKRELFYRWKKKETKEKEKRGRKTWERRRKRRKRRRGKGGMAQGRRGQRGWKHAQRKHRKSTKGTESPRTEIGRTVKNSRKKESLERKTHKENIGHVSGAVHKREIKGMGKGCKKGGGTETRKTDTTGTEAHTRKAWNTQWNNGTNWNGKMEGAARIAKRRRHRNRGHTQGKHGRRTRSPTWKHLIYIRWKPGRQGKDGAPTGWPKTREATIRKRRPGKEGRKRKGNDGRRTKRPPGTENGKRSGIHRNKAVLNRHRAHRPGHSRPRKPPPCNITAARQTKEDFHGLLMGTMTQDGPDKPVTAKANTHTYRTNHRKTEQEGPSSHPVTVALKTVPPGPTERLEKKEKTIRKTTKTPKNGAQKTSSEANP